MEKKENISKEKQITGKVGEDIACVYLEELGYEIKERNYRCRQGEIDIIVKEKELLIFVEVKCRHSLKYGYPAEAVDKRKQERIRKIIEVYQYQHGYDNIAIQIDVIEVYLKDKEYKLRHIKQAF